MIKIIFLAIPALVLLITSPFVDDEKKINIVQTYPTEVGVGEEFIMKISIEKAVITGFARMQFYLPEGFYAEEIESKGADFIFEENSIKFNWMQLPAEKKFTISYKIIPERELLGEKIISGVFVYRENNKTQRQQVPPAQITILEKAVEPINAPSVARRIISTIPDEGEYVVELTIQPNNMRESAQFTDEIPPDFTADILEARNSSFSFENGKAIFEWKNLPNVPEFTIKYVVRSGKSGPSPVINGILVYGDTIQSSESLAMYQEITSSENLTNSPEKNSIKVNNVPGTPASIAASKEKEIIYIPKTEKGITFKVQISATERSSAKSIDWFNEKYNIKSSVELTQHLGWKKYLIGSFNEYSEATAFRKQTQKNVSDAFIVVYQNGVRISVIDALRNKSYNQ